MRYLIACGIMPPELGGPAPVIRKLAEDLRKAGHEVTVITYTPNPDPIDGVRIQSVSRAGFSMARYLRFSFAVRHALKLADILLATDVFSVGLPCRFALIGSRKTFMLRLGGEWRWEQAITSGRSHETLRAFWERRPTIGDRLDLLRYRWILKRASRIMTTSEWLADMLRRAFPDVRASYVAVPNASKIHGDASDNQRPHRPLHLLYVGRFAPVKNVPFFANVIRELSQRGANVACTFVGEGETKAECEEILHGVPNATFAGAVQYDDLQQYYRESDLFVLPSLSDICPNAIVESLDLGLPCVMTKEHGLPRPLGGVIELDPQDTEAWVRAIEALTDARRYDELLNAVQLPDMSRFPTLFEAVTRL